VEKSFQMGHLVWKTIFSLGTQSGKFGKWSPSWEGPFRVIQVVSGNAYFVENLEGHSLPKPLNGKYLKHYYPSFTDVGVFCISMADGEAFGFMSYMVSGFKSFSEAPCLAWKCGTRRSDSPVRAL
jgi:hypothetical protein